MKASMIFEVSWFRQKSLYFYKDEINWVVAKMTPGLGSAVAKILLSHSFLPIFLGMNEMQLTLSFHVIALYKRNLTYVVDPIQARSHGQRKAIDLILVETIVPIAFHSSNSMVF